jgi:hypothetical protein
MALVKKHLAYFTSRSFPLGSAPSALVFPHLGFRLTQISAHTKVPCDGASEVQPRPARQIFRTKVP